MRKFTYFLLTLSLLFATNFLQAQDEEKESTSSEARIFNVGDKALNIGLGVGGLSYSVASFSPASALSFEVGFKETGDYGVLGWGALVGIKSNRYTELNIDYRYINYIFAPRVTWHPDFVNERIDKLDAYVAAQLRFRLESFYDGFNDSRNLSFGFPWPGLIFGGRYFFTDNLAVFGEAGYSISYLTGGLSLKF